MKHSKIYVALFGVLLCWFFSPTIVEAQCAMCNATASTSTADKPESALALNTGILFLMGIPYVLLTSILIIWLKFSRDRRRERAE